MNAPYKGRFKVSQVYKEAQHKGLDIVGVDSKEILSTVNGVVERCGWDSHPTGGMGLYIRIREHGTLYRYYFAHLSRAFVQVGDNIGKGQPIGIEGSTGSSTGSHCHYEVRTEPLNTKHINVAELSGIPNQLGIYRSEPLTKEEAKQIVKEAADLADSTIQYIADDYRWGDVLIVKLADAIQGVTK